MWKCVLCNSETNLLCSRCLQQAYCGRNHQKIHWKMQHRHHCVNASARLQNMTACHNVLKCGTYYDGNNHPDPEYCIHCGRTYPMGICAHHGVCKCHVINARWLAFLCYLLFGKQGTRKCVEQSHCETRKCVDKTLVTVDFEGSSMSATWNGTRLLL